MNDNVIFKKAEEYRECDDNNNYESTKMIPFDECNYENFTIRKKFNLGNTKIKCFDISSCGEFLAVTSGNDKIIIYNILYGSNYDIIPTKKYGSNHFTFTKDNYNALHTSEKVNDDIRYLCLEKKKYIRYFGGHKDDVLSLSLSPDGKTFLSSSRDGTIKLWDMRSVECCDTSSYVHLNPRVTYDPKGIVYAVSDEKNFIKFYDSRFLNCRPFKVLSSRSSSWNVNNIKFSCDGRSIIVSADGNYFYTFNTFTDEKKSFGGISNCKRLNFGVDFSPCNRYIIAGSDYGELLYYDAVKGNVLKKFKSTHMGHVENVVFHKKYLMLITGASDLIFWTPDYDNYDDDDIFNGSNW